LQEVLTNLAGNAVKFTDRGSVRVEVVTEIAPSGHTGVRFAITDTGPGLSREQMEKIFSPFYQADSSVTRKHGGTGLGTAIAKELVRLMGGTISVESEIGRGTTFHVSLAFERQREISASVRQPPQNIFVVSGERSSREIEDALRAQGVHGTRRFAPNVHRLPNLSQVPAAIIVNLDSVDEKPSEIRSRVCGYLRETHVPVFAVGASEREHAARQAGFNSFTSPGELYQGIRVFLGLARALREEYSSQIGYNESSASIRVLVAEDNMTNQAIARMALADAGFETTFVADGEGALSELTDGDYDIALIDMHMPLMDGMEVARLYNFSMMGASQRVPIVMVTADSRREIIAEAEEAGVTAFLTKPLKPSVMIETINAIVGSWEGGTGLPKPGQLDAPEASAPVSLVDDKIVADLLSYMDEPDRETFFAEFVEDAYVYIESLDHLQDDAAIEKVRNDMHALCGAARTLGADSLAALARKLEFTTGDEIRRNAVVIREDLRSLVQESSAELKRLAGLTSPVESPDSRATADARDNA
jgi:two-component system sensor histidine kinase RpfC